MDTSTILFYVYSKKDEVDTKIPIIEIVRLTFLCN